VKRLEGYVKIFVERLFKGGKLQHVRRGISIEKQIQKRNATFAYTISNFDSISFAVESIKKFQEGTFGPTPDSKDVIIKTLVQLSSSDGSRPSFPTHFSKKIPRSVAVTSVL